MNTKNERNYEQLLLELNEARSVRDRLQEIIESIYDGVFITDGNAKVIMINKGYEAVSGLRRKELIGDTMENLVKKGLISQSATLEVLKKRRAVTLNQRFDTGKKALVTANPIFDADGKINFVVTSVRDMTELYQLQEKIAESESLSLEYQRKIEAIKLQLPQMGDLIVESRAAIQIFNMAKNVAKLDTAVLLLGETGTGKSELARYIHNNSDRKNESFMTINCSVIPENLIESELFGYEGGSFTGAKKEGRIGLVEAADKGTLFLDEIGELPLMVQVKLLNFLQTGKFTRVGGRKEISIDVRTVTATNRDLVKMVDEKKFREDLYYRINVFPITVPPIRERRKDIMPIANNHLDFLNKKYNQNKKFTIAARDALESYDWPGNIRELKNSVERAFIISEFEDIKSAHFHFEVKTGKQFFTAREMDLKEYIEQEEKRILEIYYKEYGSVRKAAKALGMDPSTFVRKRQRYDERYGKQRCFFSPVYFLQRSRAQNKQVSKERRKTFTILSTSAKPSMKLCNKSNACNKQIPQKSARKYMAQDLHIIYTNQIHHHIKH